MTTFHVRATVSGFAPELSLRDTTVSFDDSDLAWALFVTGRAPGDEARHGRQSFWEFMHRVTVVPAYVRLIGSALTRSALALVLDRSEKVNLSYSLGQAMAGVFAKDVLGVTRLMHVDRYQTQHNVVITGNERPDLFGQASTGWVVIEAKGRSNLAEAALMPKLRSQKKAVASINGAAPWVAAGVVAEFDPKSGRMQLRAVDPPASAEAQDWKVDPDKYAGAYYEPFATAIAAGAETIAGAKTVADADNRLRVAELGAVGVRIGILKAIIDALQDRRERQYEGLAAAIDQILNGTMSESIRSDGSWFATDWHGALTTTAGDVRG
jgi:hypothetical protein